MFFLIIQLIVFSKRKKIWFEPKQTETRSVLVVFGFVSWNQKQKFSVCFGLFWCFKLISKNSKQTELSKQTKTTLNFLKKATKYALFQTVSVGLLFVSVQSKHRISLFRYRSEKTKTNCFNQTKQTETTRDNPKFYGKIPKYPLYQTVSVALLFVSVQ